jgi:triacylglycerol esterase/lipase EstA (alpha/beta hydrolase family)
MAVSTKVVEPFTPRRLWPPTKGMYPITKETVTIILCHGLQMSDAMDAWKTTWTNKSNVCWPQEWLPEDLGKERVRVLSMSYDSTATRWVKNQGKTERVQEIGSELVKSLVTTKEWQLDVDQTIVLIGHSFGGLVIKSLVVKAHQAALRRPANRLDQPKKEMCANFLANIGGIFFYGVPHTGSLIAKYVKNLNKVFPLQLAGIMKNLLPFQNDMEQLSVDFEGAIDQERVILYAFAEQLEYNKVLVVPWASATQLTGDNNVSLHANHVDICKPSSKESLGYVKLLQIIKFIRGEDLI